MFLLIGAFPVIAHAAIVAAVRFVSRESRAGVARFIPFTLHSVAVSVQSSAAWHHGTSAELACREDAADDVKHKGQKYADKAGDKAEDLGDKAQDKWDDAKHEGKKAANKAEDEADDFGDKAKGQAKDTKRDAER